jgi:hypothetical protein
MLLCVFGYVFPRVSKNYVAIQILFEVIQQNYKYLVKARTYCMKPTEISALCMDLKIMWNKKRIFWYVEIKCQLDATKPAEENI